MSQAVSSKIPRLCRGISKIKPVQLISERHWHGKSRWVPMFRRPPFEDFFHDRSWPGRLMEENMKTMQKLMDTLVPGSRRSMWDNDCWVSTKPAAKDVQVKYDAKEFEVKLDVESYKPEDLNVKVVGDELSISGKLKATDEHGTVTSEFSRQFIIPENVETESLESMFTNEGQLVIRGKVKGAEDIPERTININREPPKENKPESK